MNHPVVQAFPSRPIVLSISRGTWWAWLMGLLLGGVMAVNLHTNAPGIVDDLRLGDAPIARDAQMPAAGRCRGTLIVNCEFRLTYRGDRGATQTSTHHTTTLVSKIDSAQPLVVRHDPAQPGRASTSWGRSLLANRIATQLANVVGIGLIVWGLVAWQRSDWRDRRRIGAIQRQPRAVEAAVTNIRRHAATVDVDFTWVDPFDAARRTDSVGFGDGLEPLWLNGAQTSLLVLAGPGGNVFVPDSTLSQVRLSADERREIAAAQRQVALAHMRAQSAVEPMSHAAA